LQRRKILVKINKNWGDSLTKRKAGHPIYSV
jgi:hypothetical protein